MKLATACLFSVLFGCARLAADGPPAPSGAPLTLAQAIDAVLARYPSLQAAQAAVDSARGRTEESNAFLLPQVSANAGYTYMSLRPYVAFELPSGPSSFYETIENSYTATVGVRQLLTDFGRTDALVELARSGELSAEDALEQTRSQLGYQTIQAFYGVILLRASINAADEDIRALEEALRAAEKRFSSGSATKFDVLTTQVRLANAHNRRTDTQAALEKQEALLRQLLGLDPGSPLALSGNLDAPMSVPDLSTAIADGLQNRPEMKLARDSEKSAGLKVDAANRENRPELSAQATGGLQDGFLPAMYANKGYATAGVSLSVPIFSGGRANGDRAAARADLRAAEAKISEWNRVIATDVEDAFSDLKAARSRRENADTLVAQAQEALDLAKSRYANGVITDFELLDAQSGAHAAELARLQAAYDCAIARQALARASGTPPRAQP